MNFGTIKESTQKFFKECKRVIRVSKKPDKEEFFSFSKVTAIGIVIIGVIGFIMVLVSQLIGL
ncbi:MAG: protein translocase SEC61 complex subunit gamma [Methanobacteriaceae archaeon]